MGERLNKRNIAAFIIFSLSILPQFAAADGVGISVSPYSAEGYTGAATSYVVTIENKRGIDDSFQLTVSGPHFSEWGSVDRTFMAIKAGSSATAKVTLTAPVGTQQGIFGYKVGATSFTDASVKSYYDILYTVLQKYPVAISKFSPDAASAGPGQAVTLTATISNMIDVPLSGYGMDITIAGSDGSVVLGAMNMPVDLGAGETKKLAKTFTLNKFTRPDDYRATAVLRAPDGSEISKSVATFAVLAVVDVASSRTETSGITGKTVQIVLANNGNADANNYAVDERISGLWSWLVTDVKPAATRADGSALRWTISALKPGESFAVGYRVAYWPYIVIGVAVVGGIVFAALQVQKPRVIKRVLRRGPAAIGKEFAVSVEVRNVSGRTLHSVVLKDLVLPVFAVVRHFESLKPLTKKTDAGTELAWKLGDMKPHEERVVTYKISSVIGVSGVVKLSQAYVRYKDAKGRLATKHSNAPVIGEKTPTEID